MCIVTNQLIAWKKLLQITIMCNNTNITSFDILMITFLNLALDFIWWQALIWSDWTSTSIVSNSFRIFPSKSLSVTDYGTPDFSKYSQLEYFSFAQHWRSKNFILSHSVVFTCFVIMTSDFIFSWYFLNSDRSVLIPLMLDNVESNLVWYLRTSLKISSLPGFLSAASLSAILINKEFKWLQLDSNPEPFSS